MSKEPVDGSLIKAAQGVFLRCGEADLWGALARPVSDAVCRTKRTSVANLLGLLRITKRARACGEEAWGLL